MLISDILGSRCDSRPKLKPADMRGAVSMSVMPMGITMQPWGLVASFLL